MRLGLSGILVLVAALAFSGAEADAGKSANRQVACFKTTIPAPDEKPSFKKKPRSCVFIAEGALANPVPPAFAIQRTKGLRWTRWGGRKAEARGKAITPIRRKPIRVHITLSRPKRACGHRVFSKVTFRFQFNWYKKDPLYLVTC